MKPNQPLPYLQRAGLAALRPLRNRLRAIQGQELPPLDSGTPMTAFRHDPPPKEGYFPQRYQRDLSGILSARYGLAEQAAVREVQGTQARRLSSLGECEPDPWVLETAPRGSGAEVPGVLGVVRISDETAAVLDALKGALSEDSSRICRWGHPCRCDGNCESRGCRLVRNEEGDSK